MKFMIYYKRDENRQLVGLRCNYKHYYYLKNLQNDIIGIMDDNYNVIANYKYDSYGKVISVTDENGNEIIDLNHIAHMNPFRYRSYYYDEETKLYYLNSRYYNPEFGRFINADGIIGANDDVISHNLFAYVSNNYVNMCDPDGKGIGGVLAFLGLVFSAPVAGTAGSIALLGAGALGLMFLASELEKTKYHEASVTLTDTKADSVVYKKDEKKIYRKGTTNYQLTPRPVSDTNGLSFYTYPNLKAGNYTVTTVEKVNATQVLIALPELKNPDHYLINPRFESIDDWIATKENANENPHPYTILIKSISWVEKVK